MKQFLLYCLLLIGMVNLCLAQTPQPKKKPVVIPENVQIQAGPNTGDRGIVTFIYSGKKVHYITVRAADGNIWLQQNLGAQRVARSLDDDLSFGDLFQWGRWDDGHQAVTPAFTSHEVLDTNNPAGLNKKGRNPFYYDNIGSWWLTGDKNDSWTAATPAEATATNGCDPCKALGAGWRLPTYPEYQTLIKAEHINNGSSAWFSSLKLSLCGTREHDNALTEMYRGREGTYWTSTPYNNSGIGLGLNNGTLGSFYRGMGAGIRCIFAQSKTN